MRIGTITFHWATNYGAVLQSFALQTFLIEKGYEAEIIQYLPLQNILLQRLSWIKERKFLNFKTEKKIGQFRKRYLNVSQKHFFSNKALFKIRQKYDAIICGSDQVWNFSFLQYAEWNKMTLSYYLNFAEKDIQRVAYATSFGAKAIPKQFAEIIRKELKEFKQIGVREYTGQEMLNNIGITSQVVLDPTMLLNKDKYNTLIDQKQCLQKFDLFSFVLHDKQELAEQCKRYILDNSKDLKNSYNGESLSIEEWLYNEKNAQMILTNSFHATVFAILFHTPFIVVPVQGSDMDDRINTLLLMLGLEEHFIKEYDEKTITKILQTEIEWKKIDEKLEYEKIKSQQFLTNAVNVDFN